MSESTEDNDDDLNAANQTDDRDKSGTGKQGKGETGGAVAAGRAKPLSAQKNKEVWAVFRQLLGEDLTEAMVEFFGENPMRASANLVVNFAKTAASSVKSFAIVNWVMDFGDKAVRDFNKNRDRIRGAGRDSRGLIQRQKPRPAGMTITPGPAGPSGTR